MTTADRRLRERELQQGRLPALAGQPPRTDREPGHGRSRAVVRARSRPRPWSRPGSGSRSGSGRRLGRRDRDRDRPLGARPGAVDAAEPDHVRPGLTARRVGHRLGGLIDRAHGPARRPSRDLSHRAPAGAGQRQGHRLPSRHGGRRAVGAGGGGLDVALDEDLVSAPLQPARHQPVRGARRAHRSAAARRGEDLGVQHGARLQVDARGLARGRGGTDERGGHSPPGQAPRRRRTRPPAGVRPAAADRRRRRRRPGRRTTAPVRRRRCGR